MYPGVESALSMELALNFGWVLLVILMSWLWLRYAPHADRDRGMQLVALGVLLLIMFPVISVTDDLLAAQNPAEIDCCLRKNVECSSPHSILPAVAMLPLPAFTGISFAVLHIAALGHLAVVAVANAALASIQNRPPPCA
jgi:hypothetical protein